MWHHDRSVLGDSKPRSLTTRLAAAIELAFAASFLTLPASRAEDSPRLVFIGLHGGVFESLKPIADELRLRIEYLTDEQIASGKASLDGVDYALIQHVREENVAQYRALFEEAKKHNPKIRMFAVQQNAIATIFGESIKDSPLEFDPESKYSPTSRAALKRYLTLTAVKHFGAKHEIPPAVEEEIHAMAHPSSDRRFASVDDFLQWSKAQGRPAEGKPRVAVIAHQTHLEFQQAEVVKALVEAFERRGIVSAAFVDSKSQNYEELLEAFAPDVVVHTCHTNEEMSFREKLGVPHLHSVYFRKQSIDEYLQSTEGITGGESTLHVIGPERIGEIEPLVTSGTRRGGGSEEAFTPIPERVEHLVDRASSWINLRRKPRENKKIAIIYYDRELGKAELMRGSPTGMFMNAPRSLVRVLDRMKSKGYRIDPLPTTEKELLGLMNQRGRQIGLWDAAELDRLARSGHAILVEADTYRAWFDERVPKDVRAQVIDHWGPPPGKIMIWENAGKKYVVIPRIDLGNVILMPQPLRGEAHDPTVLHKGITAPPHNYIATYFWLQTEFPADALVHFGTHGNEFGLPSKQVGLSGNDWPDIIFGKMPNVNPWIIENTAEAALVKRRAYGVLIGHLPPPVVDAGLSDDLANLQGLIEKFHGMDENGLKEAFRRQITGDVKKANLAGESGVRLPLDRALNDEEIDAVADRLHEIAVETTPVSLHILGDKPRGDLLVSYLVTILKRRFLDDLEKVVDVPVAAKKSANSREKHLRPLAEQFVDLIVNRGMSASDAISAIGGKVGNGLPEGIDKGAKLALDLKARFEKTGDEVENLIEVLDGKFIPAGPVASPIRNSNAVPTGRNLYTLNPEEIPAKPAWEVGKKLVDQLIERSLKSKGRYPTRVGFTLGSMASFRDYGVMESQILYLLGVEPVWDEKDLVNDIRLIPAEQLKRPRIDIFVSNYSGGRYVANLPGRLELIDKAIRLVAELDENDNDVFANSARIRSNLIRGGVDPKIAGDLASARIFGPHLDSESTNSGIFNLVQQSGNWKERTELMDRYLSGVQYAYTRGQWGVRSPEAYREAIQGTETIVRSWSDSLRGPLSSKYYWIRGGELSMAVERLTGKMPEFLLSDVRDFDKATMITAEDALVRETRARIFNRKWVEGMTKEGYAGADQVAVMASNLMGWAVTRPGSVPQHTWAELKSVYIDDKLGISIRSWFESENPFAIQEITSIMLESVRKGYWQTDAETVQQLAQVYAESVVRHGDNAGLRTGNNEALRAFVTEKLKGTGSKDLIALSDRFSERLDAMKAKVDSIVLVPAPGEGSPTPPRPAAMPIALSAPASAGAQGLASSTNPEEIRKNTENSKPESTQGRIAKTQAAAPPANSYPANPKQPPDSTQESRNRKFTFAVVAAVVLLVSGFVFRK